ncbi:urease accessory protein UreD [Microbacterium ureisolvens]|uniref:Urease accessory protein UreD n=1 Tax=Microbacterium ureisolvens TaxID=2781186 RepID=A0ABS7HTT4_9MICO|nr:urease accessory protein UreD [Microbacterium ureisolvens]MBW9108468.1 urease accessory protein UreD [Microbacterium ureisolvens]
MKPTVVDISPRGDAVSFALGGELVVPRLVRRQGRFVEVALVAGRAMLLPGDDVRIEIAVGAGCTLRLVDIGGLVVYGRAAEVGEASQWHARVDLEAGAHLAWDGLPTVITDAGSLTRSLTITLAPGSSAFLRETLVLGRTGERGGRLRADTDVSDAIGPLVRETLEVRGDSPVPGILGANRVMDSVIAVGDQACVADVPGATRLELDRGGTVVRYLGDAAHDSPLGGLVSGAARHDREPARVV